MEPSGQISERPLHSQLIHYGSIALTAQNCKFRFQTVTPTPRGQPLDPGTPSEVINKHDRYIVKHLQPRRRPDLVAPCRGYTSSLGCNRRWQAGNKAIRTKTRGNCFGGLLVALGLTDGRGGSAPSQRWCRHQVGRCRLVSTKAG